MLNMKNDFEVSINIADIRTFFSDYAYLQMCEAVEEGGVCCYEPPMDMDGNDLKYEAENVEIDTSTIDIESVSVSVHENKVCLQGRVSFEYHYDCLVDYEDEEETPVKWYSDTNRVCCDFELQQIEQGKTDDNYWTLVKLI